MVAEAAVVDIVPVEGDVMVNAGAVVSGLPPPVPPPEPVVMTDCRVIVTDCETWVATVEAVIVIAFVPITSGTLMMLQADASPAAVPEAPPLADHATVMAPVPPAADPEKLTLDAVVVEATAFTVRPRAGVGVGVGVGFGTGIGGGTVVTGVGAA
jgi:hypothetical protein